MVIESNKYIVLRIKYRKEIVILNFICIVNVHRRNSHRHIRTHAADELIFIIYRNRNAHIAPIKIKIHNTKNTRHDTDIQTEITCAVVPLPSMLHPIEKKTNMHMRDQKLHLKYVHPSMRSMWNDDDADDKNNGKNNLNYVCMMLALTAIKHDDFDVFDIRSLWLLSINIKRCDTTTGCTTLHVLVLHIYRQEIAAVATKQWCARTTFFCTDTDTASGR